MLPGVSDADDGRADQALRTALSGWWGRPDPRAAVVVTVALVDARVFVPVVAAATGLRDGPHGLRAEAGTEMSLVTLVGASGATAVAAFTDAAAMAAWRTDVRPVAVPGPVACATALSEGHAALVLDVAGPAFVVDGVALDALARGEVPAGAGAARAADPAALEVVRPPGDRAVLERLAEAVAPALDGEAWLVGLRSRASVGRADADGRADGRPADGRPADGRPADGRPFDGRHAEDDGPAVVDAPAEDDGPADAGSRDVPPALALGLGGTSRPGRLEAVGTAVAARLPRDAPPLDLLPLHGHLLAQARAHGLLVTAGDSAGTGVSGGPLDPGGGSEGVSLPRVVKRSPGPSPGASGTRLASRNAACSDDRPSRNGAAWTPRSPRAAVTSPASAWMSLRASSRSCSASPSSASPVLTAAALIRCRAAELMTSMAGTSAMSRAAADSSSLPSGAAAWVAAPSRDATASCDAFRPGWGTSPPGDDPVVAGTSRRLAHDPSQDCRSRSRGPPAGPPSWREQRLGRASGARSHPSRPAPSAGSLPVGPVRRRATHGWRGARAVGP